MRDDKQRALLSWSSGKDSAWCLHVLRQQPGVEVAGLLTTFNAAADRVAMHAVRRSLAELQAQAVGLPLIAVDLPWPCPNAAYENAMQSALKIAVKDLDIQAVAFGDLFLADIRSYREKQMSAWGLEPLFPIWNEPTVEFSRKMLEGGLQAILTCVDPKQCPGEFIGRQYDLDLLHQLPENVDPCGENGEFHTFAFNGPMFDAPIEVKCGEIVVRDGFVFVDLVPAPR